MAWKKNSQEAIRRFDELVAAPGAQRKLMFGCPVYELHGQRYAMLQENRVVLRLSTDDAAQLIAKGGRTWEPMKGRPRKDRIVVPEAITGRVRSLRVWVRRAVEYAQSR
jgi:TfoX/Sxy family transcriptional regulator of competence genes